MASSDQALEDELIQAGNKLANPPSSTDELLPLLDQTESCLARIEQAPQKSLLDAVSPSKKALMAEELLRHSDNDVKVAVASCISEITRITAPEAPFDDDQMKEVFQLIVSSFENLHDTSSRSYAKMLSMVETVAKVRSCVVMLDLECDSLIVEMFRHFFKAVRVHHPEHVLSSMETIMALVIEESEDISMELLSPILASVKKDNEEYSPNAQKLGERVLERCAEKLKPYLMEAVKTLSVSLDDYSKVLASVCQEASSGLEQNDARASSENAEDEGKLVKATLNESTQVTEEDANKATRPQRITVVVGRSSKSVKGNGTVQSSKDGLLEDPKSLKKKDVNIPSNEDPDNVSSKKVDNTGQKPEQAIKGRRKQRHSTKLAEPSEGSAEKKFDSKSNKKKLHENHSNQVADYEKESHGKVSSGKVGIDESEVAASPSSDDETRSQKTRSAKKRARLAKEVVISSGDVKKKFSDVKVDSDAKPFKQSAKKASGGSSDVKKSSAVVSVEKRSGGISDLEGKRRSAKKDGTDKAVGSSSRQKENKRQKQGKVEKSVKDEKKEKVSSPKSGEDDESLVQMLKASLKRKTTPGPGKENNSKIKKYGENLVGCRIKVWWPDDNEFYSGTVESFDSAEKKHKVAYDDGDIEILNLRTEKWELVQGEDDHASPDVSADMPSNKSRKKSAGQSTKERNTDTLTKSGGSASSKSKGASQKSGNKSKDGTRGDIKSKDSKSMGKSQDVKSKKSKDHGSRGGSNKSADAAPVVAESSDSDTPKTSKSKVSSKAKQETPKKPKKETSSTPASKGKASKSGEKSNVNTSGKGKSGGTSKTKNPKNEISADSAEKTNDKKVKASSSSKAQGSAAKPGKKRKRN